MKPKKHWYYRKLDLLEKQELSRIKLMLRINRINKKEGTR